MRVPMRVFSLDHNGAAVCKPEMAKHLEARRPVKTLFKCDIGW